VRVVRQADQTLGLSAADSQGYALGVQGGRLGALISLKNELLQNIAADLDTLARSIIDCVNQYHVQGLGVGGSFTELSGWSIDSSALGSAGGP
jgi:hypothetical protein